MKTRIPPTLEEFASYWKDYNSFSWRDLVPYVVYLGGLGLYAFAINRIDPEGRFWLLAVVGALAYLILLPYSWIRSVHARKSQFIRCRIVEIGLAKIPAGPTMALTRSSNW